jgi:hypothetical protein
VAARCQSGQVVLHPEQFRTVVPAASVQRAHVPLGHLVPAPLVVQRPLADYDQLCGVQAVHAVQPSVWPADQLAVAAGVAS